MAFPVLIFIVCVTLAKAQEGEIIVPDNKTQCMNDMVEWCDSMQYPQQSAGLTILSIIYEDPNGYYRVFCSSDSAGTNCTRNASPWFVCTPDHVLIYKGQTLSNETSADDIDDDICTTADKAFNELYVQNLSYNNNVTLQTEVQTGMEAFFEQIAEMEEQIDLIKRFLSAIPYIGDLWNMVDEQIEEKGFGEPVATPNDRNQIATNQVEKE